MYKKFTDEELVELLRQGKDKAFDELYFRYRDVLVRFVYIRMKSVPVSEEIVQEVFTAIWERRKVLVIQKKFSAYIYTSVRYVTLDYIKSHTVTDQYVKEVIDRNTNDFSGSNTTEDSIYYEELQEAVDKATLLLPKKIKRSFYSQQDQALYQQRNSRRTKCFARNSKVSYCLCFKVYAKLSG